MPQPPPRDREAPAADVLQRALGQVIRAIAARALALLHRQRTVRGVERAPRLAGHRRVLARGARRLEFLPAVHAVPEQIRRQQRDVHYAARAQPEEIIRRDTAILEPAQRAKDIRAEDRARRAGAEQARTEILALVCHAGRQQHRTWTAAPRQADRQTEAGG